MKYNEKMFNDSVDYYIKSLRGKINNRLLFLICDFSNEKAFFSIAPLSRAIHELNGEMHVIVRAGELNNFKVLQKTWDVFDELNKGIKSKETKALKDFIDSVEKKANSNRFSKIFKRPEFFICSDKNGFSGNICLDYKAGWFKPYRWNDMLKTTKALIVKGYGLKKNEKFGIGFELIPKKSDMGLPLEDYLDSYSIARTMALEALRVKAKVSLSSATGKFSVLVDCVRTTDLMTTLVGCEFDKNVKENVFKKFKILSPLICANKIEFNDASFGIHGKGYSGKLFFGENIGFPTLNRKTRWSSPGQMFLKDRYEAQTRYETRDPVTRYALTETLPLDIFIETCNVDYTKIRARSKKIKSILDKCEVIKVIGQKINGLQTNFSVYLTNKKIRREFISSDSDVTSKIDLEYYKKTKIKAGMYGNFPSGEAFVTPEKIEGVIVGDVVVNVDQSYRLYDENPLVLEVKNYEYRILRGPRQIVAKMNKEKNEVMQKIRAIEKSRALPKSITDMYKKCFNYIGEFAVNLNPKAKVCDYLIVNEKIAKMMHVAMGSGFEPDRKTLYHWDMVINSPRQKMDVYGIDSKGNEHWVIKKGEFVV